MMMHFHLTYLLGIGNSGGDISVELSRHAKQVFLSTRRGAWVFSRMAAKGCPSDQYKNRRIMTMIPKFIFGYVGKTIANDRFDHEKFGLKPDHGVFQQHPMVNDDLPIRMATGSLKIKSNVKLIKENSKFRYQLMSLFVMSLKLFHQPDEANGSLPC